MTVEIVPADPDRVPDLAVLLGHAFVDDEIIRWPFPAGDDLARTIRLFEILNAEFSRAGMLWEAPEGRGVAMWVPPDGLDRYLEAELATREPVTALTDDGGVRYHAFWDWIESKLPDERQWFLDHVAVAESERGKGIGSALIRFGLEQAKRDGVPVTLETARRKNVPLYATSASGRTWRRMPLTAVRTCGSCVPTRRRHQPASVRVPRFASWSAMMLRWISEVPSQIRSTRSSR